MYLLLVNSNKLWNKKLFTIKLFNISDKKIYCNNIMDSSNNNLHTFWNEYTFFQIPFFYFK